MRSEQRPIRNFALTAAAALCLTGPPALAADTARAPLPPGNAAPTLRLPPRDASGAFETPNRDLHGERAFWNVRIALNAAAIGCRGPRAAQLVADYNHLLGHHAALVRTSEAQVIAALARSAGGNGIAARDKLSTRLFNYFAQPPAQSGFCEAAADVASELSAGTSDHARHRATAWLAKLDQPFVDFYHDYDRYQVAMVAWRALTSDGAAGGDDGRSIRPAQLANGQ